MHRFALATLATAAVLAAPGAALAQSGPVAGSAPAPAVRGSISSNGSSVTVGAPGVNSPSPLVGAGPVVTDSRVLAPWTRVTVDAPIELTVSAGGAPEATLHAQANLLPLLRTTVEGDTLRVFATGPFSSRSPVRMTLAAPKVVAMTLGGGAQAVVLGLASSSFLAHLAGAGSLGLAGRVNALTVHVHGPGQLDARQLHAGTASMLMLGSGNAAVSASEMVEITSMGSGTVLVNGRPAQRHVDVRGTGRVTFQ